ncbi:MAG: hypothetical protein APF84_19075 [Gracilibacter sp. BRH_c7a]|nr:MAG: hypothetical protein APF84_19075 [Gracilibacter sp. BRH_c7a]
MIEDQKSNENRDPALRPSILPPALGNILRPVAVLGVRGVLEIAALTKTALQLAREEMEDIVAEAHFERLRKKMDDEIESNSTRSEQTTCGE